MLVLIGLFISSESVLSHDFHINVEIIAVLTLLFSSNYCEIESEFKSIQFIATQWHWKNMFVVDDKAWKPQDFQQVVRSRTFRDQIRWV